MRTSFTTLKQLIAERFGEPELSGPIEATFDLPWVDESDLEHVIIRCVHDILRSIPQAELDTFGTDATELITLTDGQAFPSGIIRIIGVQVTGDLGPAEPVSEVGWFQRSQNEDQNYVWSIIGGVLHVNGPGLDMVVVTDGSVADLQHDSILLPDGSDRDVVDRVVRWLKVSRDMEVGRA